MYIYIFVYIQRKIIKALCHNSFNCTKLKKRIIIKEITYRHAVLMIVSSGLRQCCILDFLEESITIPLSLAKCSTSSYSGSNLIFFTLMWTLIPEGYAY